MMNNFSNCTASTDHTVVTAGSLYLDIDAYACCIAMKELLELRGVKAAAYSRAACNYSVCRSLIRDGQLLDSLPPEFLSSSTKYIVVDVSDPDYIRDGAPPEQVTEVYDHHTGFEAYWEKRIGKNAHIDFIGAAATLIYHEWEKAGLQDSMSRPTALLLIAAILDNTLDLTSSNTTPEDIRVFDALCNKEQIGDEWRAAYFSEVQDSVEADLKNALYNDVKIIRDHPILPENVSQICVWDAQRIIGRLDEIRQWFNEKWDGWMMNIIDIKRRCSYFVCDDAQLQQVFAQLFGVRFDSGVAKAPKSYLRKEIIKMIQNRYT